MGRSGPVALGVEGVDQNPACTYALRMRNARVTVTVPEDVLASAERRVERGEARSLSAWVGAAMEEKARREDLVALLAEMRAQGGDATEEEQAWARNVLGL